MRKKLLFVSLSLFLFLFINCENQPSLQTYFVEKMEDPSFLIVNLPFQLENIFDKTLTEEDMKTIASVGKLNLLVYRPKDGEQELLDNEFQTIQNILDNNRYQHLIDFKAFDKGQGSFMFEGETDQVEEGIVIVSIQDNGFGVLRILGSEINPVALSKLIKKVSPSLLKKEISSSSSGLKNLF